MTKQPAPVLDETEAAIAKIMQRFSVGRGRAIIFAIRGFAASLDD